MSALSGGVPWQSVARLVERVVDDEHLVESLVAGVRTAVRDITPLAPADVAGHTRALLIAAARAVAERRAPTEAELAFVEELAVTRAGQGVPVEAVLSAVHLASRSIWSRARELAPLEEVTAVQLLEARELYDDWAEVVRTRLVGAHRRATAEQAPRRGDRDVALLRRLLAGGTAAALAAVEAGHRETTPLLVAVARPGDAATVAAFEAAVRGRGVLLGRVDALLVAVAARLPAASRSTAVRIGLAGPAEPEELHVLRDQAVAALGAVEIARREGCHHVSDLPTLAALGRNGDLGLVLAARHHGSRTELAGSVDEVARTVRAWVEHDRDVRAVARELFVHPNTVRNRVQRFADVTGVDPWSCFGAVDAWWLCHSWLTEP
ncbi:helix-turn-helix domain-containing protein [Nocardioides ferulae]|uniref:helix-turn-helix domain-containing protein n=1 Tax=Nocardioides ferulae TaxID=2340821 RepID=UPI000EACA469|nr:helix-turn-helix domain-containing protein [Nocardioides ferulae]